MSGGSFTALAYGLYGDKLFADYEQRFLKRDVQGELLAGALSPGNWGNLSSTGWGRSELAAQLYDEILFNGATYGDLVSRSIGVSVRLIASAKCLCAVAAACTLAGFELVASAQDIEPRAYSNAPVGVNFLIAGYAYTRGGVAFGPSLPITNPNLHTSNAVVAYARVLDLWGMSGKFDATVPYTWLSGTADYRGQTVPRTVNGFANSAFRLSINLYGAPALSLKEFADWEQDLIIGASFRVVAPWGQYDDSKLVNIGTNRWSFKPAFGISKAIGPWTMELEAAATLYTDNNEFFGGKTLSQAPIYSMQGHLIYGFRSGIWASLDATYFVGGRTTVNGVRNSDLHQNWRVGGTLAFPVDRENSIKLYASSGVSARTGDSYDLIGVAWQYRWGGGL